MLKEKYNYDLINAIKEDMNILEEFYNNGGDMYENS